MPIRRVVTYPDQRLRDPTIPVVEFGEPLSLSLIKDMEDTMLALDGVGIAANQINSKYRVFVLNCVAEAIGSEEGEPLLKLFPRTDSFPGPPMVFANPEIISSSEVEVKDDEGCLSFPGIMVEVSRPETTRVRAQDIDGEWFVADGSGLWARAIHHEVDHLDGLLLIDTVGPVRRSMIERKMAKRKRCTT